MQQMQGGSRSAPGATLCKNENRKFSCSSSSHLWADSAYGIYRVKDIGTKHNEKDIVQIGWLTISHYEGIASRVSTASIGKQLYGDGLPLVVESSNTPMVLNSECL